MRMGTAGQSTARHAAPSKARIKHPKHPAPLRVNLRGALLFAWDVLGKRHETRTKPSRETVLVRDRSQRGKHEHPQKNKGRSD